MNPGSSDTEPPPRKYPTEFQRRMLWRAITAVSLLAVCAVAVYAIIVVTDVLQFLQPVLVPVAFAGILAYLLEPIVKRLTDRGTPRFRAMMLVWLGFHGLLLLLFLSVAVPTVRSVSRTISTYMKEENKGQLMTLVSNFLTDTIEGVDRVVEGLTGKGDGNDKDKAATPAEPAMPPGTHTVHAGENIASIAFRYQVEIAALEAKNAGRKVEPGMILELPANASVTPRGKQSWVRTRFSAWLAGNSEEIASSLSGFFSRSFQGFVGLFGYLVGFVLVPLYLYYFLKESAGIKKNWSLYIPLRASGFKAELVDCLTEVNGYLIAFFRGQMLVSMIDGFFVGVALALIGLPYAMLIGVFVALLGLIPYVGNLVCWFAAVLLSVAHFGKTVDGEMVNTLWGIQKVWAYPLIVTGIFVVVQQINSLVTAPRIVGDAVGLHPLTVIFSVLFWSLLIGGLLGALLAVPLTASLKVVFRRYIWERRVQPQLAQAAPGDGKKEEIFPAI
ncbi:MAG TPA: AI-2E family transporter [Verrucomicrobiales bacterium]|nr:AI-2E family transporter [Verrucomicrobiales bacterium]